MLTRSLSVFYRLLLPLVLAIGLLPMFEASGNTAPALSCRFTQPQIDLAGNSTLELVLSNVQNATLSKVNLTIVHDNTNLLDPYAVPLFEAGDILAQDISDDTSQVGRLVVNIEAVEPAPFAVNEGVLARARFQSSGARGLLQFTLTINSVTITRPNETITLTALPPTCYLAIGNDVVLPTATPTSPLSSILPTSTATPTPSNTPPPTVPTPTFTHTPTFTPQPSPTPTWTFTFTPVPTPTWTSTPTVLMVATPTPRDGLAQSPLPTPIGVATTPAVSTVVSTLSVDQTPDIAATLTVEARTTLLDIAEEIVLDPLLGTPIGSVTPTPLFTQTPSVELLSPPTLPETTEESNTATGDVLLEDTQSAAASVTAIPAPSPAAVALTQQESASLTRRAQIDVEQPPAGAVLQRRPFYLTLSWITFVSAVVLVFTSWWLRRER